MSNVTNKKFNARHGDLAFIGIYKLPDGLKLSDSKLLMQGSGGHDHRYDNGEFYPKQEDNFIIGYFVAKNTTLSHVEHGNICSVCGYDTLKKTSTCPKCKTDFAKDGKLRLAKIVDQCYQLKRQNEDTNAGMRPVLD